MPSFAGGSDPMAQIASDPWTSFFRERFEIIQRLWTLFNPIEFSGYSFRRGVIDTALAAGISLPDIMEMGR